MTSAQRRNLLTTHFVKRHTSVRAGANIVNYPVTSRDYFVSWTTRWAKSRKLVTLRVICRVWNPCGFD